MKSHKNFCGPKWVEGKVFMEVDEEDYIYRIKFVLDKGKYVSFVFKPKPVKLSELS